LTKTFTLKFGVRGYVMSFLEEHDANWLSLFERSNKKLDTLNFEF